MALFDVGSGLKGAIEGIGNVADKLFTSDGERLDKQAFLQKVRQEPQLAQILLNTQEAKHRTVFVAGWRPFIGWTCGVALAYHYIAQPFLLFILSFFVQELPALPELETSALITLLGGLLGLGHLRTKEKLAGKVK